MTNTTHPNRNAYLNEISTETDRIFAGKYYIIANMPHIVKGAGERTVEPNTRVMCMEDAPAGSWDVVDIELSNGDTNQVYSFELRELSDYTQGGLKMIALAEHLDVCFEDIINDAYDGMMFAIDRETYLVCTDAEANDRAGNMIKAELWTFEPSFLIPHTILSTGMERVIEVIVNAKWEDSTPILESLIPDMDALIADAINSDGRGHFLNFYDGEENASQGFYIYQQ